MHTGPVVFTLRQYLVICKSEWVQFTVVLICGGVVLCSPAPRFGSGLSDRTETAKLVC